MSGAEASADDPPATRRAPFAASVRPEFAAVSPLCDAAVAHAEEAGAGERARYALRLVLEELLTNVAKYASARGDVAVRVDVVPGTIRVRIEDDGVPFDPAAAAAAQAPPPAAPSLATAQVGGLGLRMVRSSARALRYRRTRGRNVVEAEIPLAPRPAR